MKWQGVLDMSQGQIYVAQYVFEEDWFDGANNRLIQYIYDWDGLTEVIYTDSNNNVYDHTLESPCT